MFGNDCTGYHVIAMTEDAMKARTKAFALRVIRLTASRAPFSPGPTGGGRAIHLSRRHSMSIR